MNNLAGEGEEKNMIWNEETDEKLIYNKKYESKSN